MFLKKLVLNSLVSLGFAVHSKYLTIDYLNEKKKHFKHLTKSSFCLLKVLSSLDKLLTTRYFDLTAH